MDSLALFGHPDSGHACKVALALSLAELSHRTVWVDIWADPSERPKEFLAASPFKEVPLLQIDGESYTQSGAILLEIATRYKCLGGETPAGLRRGRELLMWEANRIGMCLPQLKEARRVDGAGFPDGAIEWLRNRFDADAKNLAVLLGENPFFHGDRPGIGDCAIWGYTQWLDGAGVKPTPPMQDWLKRMRGLKAMKTPQEFFPRR
ncbi:glutathione S-transferase family protein [Actibacterium pelagium]|uniref:Glutathione S-transferase n=1 Tax=Actibacterium pelagium TaxID=2029103 RepID=A0A917AID3_9RHOB|nr:glutathione S-transferase family protein [Actibacterium pelagium]GGE53048.1 glutathione S-transferase [Actibacterium pelagium]